MNEPRHPLCPNCHGFSRYVSESAVFPEKRLTLERMFYCPPCKTYARSDTAGIPIEGMADITLHKLRQKVVDRLASSTLSKENLQGEMCLPLWSMDFSFWDAETCLRALNTVLLPSTQRAKNTRRVGRPTAKELLS